MATETRSHSADISPDEDGWWWAACACGWIEGPFDGRTDATDAYGDHRYLQP